MGQSSRTVTPKGKRMQESILQASLGIATREGLESVSFGRLAKALGVSKSGLFSHFKTKQELQLATLAHAGERFAVAVIQPVVEAPRGLPRLWTLCTAWLAYAEGRAFEGGCFFQTVTAEYDNRPGAIRDQIKEGVVAFNEAIQTAIRGAQTQGDLRPEVDPHLLAFEIHSLMAGANGGFQLFGDPEVFELCRRCLRDRLRSLLTPNAPALPGLSAS